jgi:hypothetical protein
MRLADGRQSPRNGAGLCHLGQLHQVQRQGLGTGRQCRQAPVGGPGAELGPVRAVGPDGGLGLGGVVGAGQALTRVLIWRSDARYLTIIARQKRGFSLDPGGHRMAGVGQADHTLG